MCLIFVGKTAYENFLVRIIIIQNIFDSKISRITVFTSGIKERSNHGTLLIAVHVRTCRKIQYYSLFKLSRLGSQNRKFLHHGNTFITRHKEIFLINFKVEQMQKVQGKPIQLTITSITNHASRLVCRNDPEIKWPPQSMYYA